MAAADAQRTIGANEVIKPAQTLQPFDLLEPEHPVPQHHGTQSMRMTAPGGTIWLTAGPSSLTDMSGPAIDRA